MSNPQEDRELYELLRHADQLINDEPPDDDFMPEFDDSMETEPDIVYRNAANGYGVQQPDPSTPPPPEEPFTINAYNADFRNTPQHGRLGREPVSDETTVIPRSTAVPRQDSPRQTYADNDPAPRKKAKKPRRRRRHLGCLTSLMVVVLLVGGIAFGLHLFIRPPQNPANTGSRKANTATILLCGTDVSGDRTDTMMLLYVDGNSNEAGLLTLPRDTYTKTSYDLEVKLNSAYGRNGGGEEGMDVLLDYVQKLIGYRPDGYLLVDLGFMRELIDLMGGVEFDVPQDMTLKDRTLGIDVTLEAGMQHLSGDEALAVLRFRHGYFNQDIGRQDVQKQFLKACMDQWFTLENLKRLPELMSAFKAETLSNLSTGNYLWCGINLLQSGFSSIKTDTLPGYSDMIGDQSFYVLYPSEVMDLVNGFYNPFTAPLLPENFSICTE